jgi:hypothetical protein
VLDEDPNLIINQKTFYKYFNICLNEQTGLALHGETNFDYITKTMIVAPGRYCSIEKNWCRVSGFEFEKVKDQWKLTLIYFDTRKQ